MEVSDVLRCGDSIDHREDTLDGRFHRSPRAGQMQNRVAQEPGRSYMLHPLKTFRVTGKTPAGIFLSVREMSEMQL